MRQSYGDLRQHVILFYRTTRGDLTAPPSENKIKGIIWNRSYLTLPPDIQARHRGLQDWRVWWLLFVGIVLSTYGFFIWWRIQHPW